MTVTELRIARLSDCERCRLRDALLRRRHRLSGALRVYRDSAISAGPRAMLARDTRRAIREIDRAVRQLNEPFFGICYDCRQPLTVAALALHPEADRCQQCEDAGWSA